MTENRKTAPSLRAMGRPVGCSVVVALHWRITLRCAFKLQDPASTCGVLFPPIVRKNRASCAT